MFVSHGKEWGILIDEMESAVFFPFGSIKKAGSLSFNPLYAGIQNCRLKICLQHFEKCIVLEANRLEQRVGPTCVGYPNLCGLPTMFA